MNHFFKLSGIALLAAIAFSFSSCVDGNDEDDQRIYASCGFQIQESAGDVEAAESYMLNLVKEHLPVTYKDSLAYYYYFHEYSSETLCQEFFTNRAAFVTNITDSLKATWPDSIVYTGHPSAFVFFYTPNYNNSTKGGAYIHKPDLITTNWRTTNANSPFSNIDIKSVKTGTLAYNVTATTSEGVSKQFYLFRSGYNLKLASTAKTDGTTEPSTFDYEFSFAPKGKTFYLKSDPTIIFEKINTSN